MYYVEDSKKAKALFAESKKLASLSALTIVIAPPAPLLSGLALRNRSRVSFAAQDVSATLGGAQTGEVTAAACAAAGASYAIVGHSERRAAGDSNAVVAEKLVHILAHDLTPILCVGERARDNEGLYLSFVREELTSALAPLSAEDRARVIIAYEPIWAIGKTAEQSIEPHDLVEMTLYIRKVLAELLPGKSSTRVPVLYGGSVEPGNIRELAGSTVDGFLIGHASVDKASFTALVRNIA